MICIAGAPDYFQTKNSYIVVIEPGISRIEVRVSTTDQRLLVIRCDAYQLVSQVVPQILPQIVTSFYKPLTSWSHAAKSVASLC